MGFWARTDKHQPQSPFSGQFFVMTTLPSMSLIFQCHYLSPPSVMNVFLHTCPRCLCWLTWFHASLGYFSIVMNYGKRCFTLNIILYIHTLLVVGSLAVLSVGIPKTDTYLFIFYVCFFVSKSLKKIMKAMFFFFNVWWHAATLFIYFYINRADIHVIYTTRRAPLLLSSLLSAR